MVSAVCGRRSSLLAGQYPIASTSSAATTMNGMAGSVGPAASTAAGVNPGPDDVAGPALVRLDEPVPGAGAREVDVRDPFRRFHDGLLAAPGILVDRPRPPRLDHRHEQHHDRDDRDPLGPSPRLPPDPDVGLVDDGLGHGEVVTPARRAAP